MTTEHTLRTQRMSLAYDDRTVVHDLDLEVPPGLISVVVGANACGKSTAPAWSRPAARSRAPERSCSTARSIHEMPTRDVARTLGLLPQSPVAPEGITRDRPRRARAATRTRAGCAGGRARTTRRWPAR